MPSNYLFLDADGSILTARSSITAGSAHEPYVQVTSFLSAVPVTPIGGNQSVSGTVINTNKAASFALADGVSNSTHQLESDSGGTIRLATAPHVFNGTNWDRQRGNSSIGALVNTGAGSVITLQSGTQISSIVSTVPSSVLVGASIFGQLPGGTAVLGSVATLQGTNPWLVQGDVSGSVLAVQSGTRITSIVSATPSSVLVGASIFGQLPGGTAVLGSVAALQGTNPWIVTGSVQAAVSGSVATVQSGTVITSLVSTVPSSVLVGASIFGQLPAGTAPLGSVATLQGTNPWIVTGSVQAAVSGAVAAVQSGTQTTSIVGSIPSSTLVGTYGHRNDAVASYLGADLTWRPFATDSAGRTLIRPFAAEESRIEGYASTVNVSVTTLVAAAGAGLRNYITDIWLANTGATTTLVTFRSGGGTSVLGYTIVPTASGSNLPGLQTPIRTLANETFDIQATTATSVLYATVKGFRAP